MPNALLSILIAFLLSISTLLLVLTRVSPLLSPDFALPFFFTSILIAVSSFTALVLALAKGFFHRPPEGVEQGAHPFLSRTFLQSSVRQGMFLGVASCIVLLLFLLRILNWWIALLVYLVFLLIEMAVGQ